MLVPAKMIGTQVCQLILGFYVMDADLALFHQFLYEKIPQRNILGARTVGVVASGTPRLRLVNVQRHAAKGSR